ncbi:hypothetical protein BTA51_02080 [Hahella sp. CCB-MM4]|uniref:DUF4350 domain-containing protein n=1 Tax=Hahella sp. (strain CCB-MM4) TaxID=1926491 RepID=UPI000B9A4F05|nr:DUF4350 domain-containing protein [Hahella sp. CCB-MM4]OZG75196.1 hypothetical protein BTA51_02080 [Hahella sp. CCB-MM4]
MRRSLVISLLVVALLALGYLVYRQIEWVDYEKDLGPTQEARRDPYFGAKLYLDKLNISHESKLHFRDFDDPTWADSKPLEDTVVLVDAYGSLSEARAKVLLDWVSRGGHVIAAASNPFLDDPSGVDDPLFEYFGVEVERNDDSELDSDVWDAIGDLGHLSGWSDKDVCEFLPAQTSFYFEDYDDYDVKAHFLTADILQADPDDAYSMIGSDYYDGSLMVQFEHGDGLVTFMVSFSMWQNWAIGCLDHAYIFWQLVPGAGEVTFYRNQDFPGLGSVIWKYFHLSLVIALLLLVGWLWMRGSRFGPVREYHPSLPRQLLEHIDASARFLWRMDKGQTLLKNGRDMVLSVLRYRYPEFLQMETEERLRHLAKVLHMTPEEIDLALWRDIQGNTPDFVHAVRLLQMIKEKL